MKTLEIKPGDELERHAPYSPDEMLKRVRRTADEALSNALIDLYEERLRDALSDKFLLKEELLRECLLAGGRVVLKLLGVLSVVLAIIVAYAKLTGLI